MAEIITGNYRLLKDLNSNVILNLVRTNAPISGAELAKITGMRPSTVHNILKNLEKERMVLKIGTGSSTKAGERSPTREGTPCIAYDGGRVFMVGRDRGPGLSNRST